MKTKVAISLLVLFFAACSMNAQKSTSGIVGTWKLVSFKYGNQETKSIPDSIQRIKLITPTHFTWVQYISRDNLVKSTAGGTYVLDGENYIENIDFGLGMNYYLGTQSAFKIRIEGDKMYLSGELSSNLKIEEVWSKIES
jgi:hypothetical protein